MLKQTFRDNKFEKLKCGEIFYFTSTICKVTCLLCGQDVDYDLFPNHFQDQHMMLFENKFNKDHQNSNEILNTLDLLKNESTKEYSYETIFDDYASDIKTDEIDGEIAINVEDMTAINTSILEEKVLLSVKEDIYQSIKIYNSKEDDKFKVEESSRDPQSQSDEIIDLEKAFKCERCSTFFQLKRDLNQHMRQCEKDQKEFSLDNCMKKSTEKPIGKLFSCTQCSRVYKHKKNLTDHMRTYHGPNLTCAPQLKYKCDECEQTFRAERHLRAHKLRHKGLICETCGRKFTQIGNMIRHMKRHTGIKDFKCKDCEYTFYTEKELRLHMIRHTGNMPIICEICGKRCRERGVLTAHMRRHTGERPAKCNVCGKSFFSIYDLNVHAVAHTDERPFACDVCGSTFQRKKALRIHKKIHSKERNYKCQICDKSYTQSGGLNAHMRTHGASFNKKKVQASEISQI